MTFNEWCDKNDVMILLASKLTGPRFPSTPGLSQPDYVAFIKLGDERKLALVYTDGSFGVFCQMSI